MNEEFLTVSQLNTFIKDVIQAGFPQPVWVCGEIQGYDRQKGKNHIFFQLVEKDPDSHQQKATIDLVIWAGKKGAIETVCRSAEDVFEIRDDIEVKFLCQVDFYPPHGRVRLSVESIDPFFTLGKMAQEKQKLIARLKEEGALDKNKQLELTRVPLHVGVVTSDDSAAYNDFLSELKKSGYGFKVYLRNSLMQGKKAEKDVCSAMEDLSRIKGLDAIVITRGGGSLSELSCFDSEMIVKRIAASTLPVLSGIGHEINITVTDLAAHTHAKTPTAIAKFLVERIQDFCEQLDRYQEGIIEKAFDMIEEEKAELKGRALGLQSSTHQFFKDHSAHIIRMAEAVKTRPSLILREHHKNLIRYRETLAKSVKSRVHNDKSKLQGYQKIIDVASPVNTMKRGFSITRTGEGKLLKNTTGLHAEVKITTELAKGTIESQVVKISKE